MIILDDEGQSMTTQYDGDLWVTENSNQDWNEYWHWDDSESEPYEIDNWYDYDDDHYYNDDDHDDASCYNYRCNNDYYDGTDFDSGLLAYEEYVRNHWWAQKFENY